MGLRIPCLRCGKFEPECRCEPLPSEPEPPPPPAPVVPAPKARIEVIKMRREKRGGGREVVILEGFPRDVNVEYLARDLKKLLGCGGGVKGWTVEIQGDHRDRIADFLAGRGFKSVRAGG
ncbi:MAG: translation initiation factor [Planctomycetes bacterium]|nr:translation initiation factor [Planctomycetota bacterium]